MYNEYNAMNTMPAMPQMPAANPRKGKAMAAVALIVGIVGSVLALISTFIGLIYGYSWDFKPAVIIASCSMILLAPLILALILGINARKRGSGKGMMIATIIVSGAGLVSLFANARMILNYIFML